MRPRECRRYAAAINMTLQRASPPDAHHDTYQNGGELPLRGRIEWAGR